jgi:YD repeat-containing protein
MKRHALLLLAPLTAMLAAALLAGCLEKKDYDEIRYFRSIRRGMDGSSRGVGEITRKQADTEAHWRFYLRQRRVERLESYDAAGALVREVRLSYDEQGRVSEERTYLPDRQLESKLAIAYDAQGRVSGYKYYTEEAGFKEERQWQYDQQGRLSEVLVYGHGGILRWKDQLVYDRQEPSKLLGVNRYDSKHALVEQIAAKDYTF